MNISINKKAVQAVVAVAALGVAFTAGAMTGGSVDATLQQAPTVRSIEQAPAQQFVYHIVDSRQAALDVERAEYVTAQERVLVGIVSPERVLHVIDDSAEGRMTALEAVFVATGGR